MFPISECEKIMLPQGAIYLGPSDENRSVGYLELLPHTSLTLHNRPVTEELTQVQGKCAMIVFASTEGKIHVLNTGDRLDIDPAVWHIHSNPYEETSLTYWDFKGDIRTIIDGIRTANQ